MAEGSGAMREGTLTVKFGTGTFSVNGLIAQNTDVDMFRFSAGAGAFSIAVSGTEDTVRYIQSQKEHHRVHSFKDELIAFLDKHGIEYKEWMLD